MKAPLIKGAVAESFFAFLVALGLGLLYELCKIMVEIARYTGGDFTEYQISLVLFIIFSFFLYKLILRLFRNKVLMNCFFVHMINAKRQGAWYQPYIHGFGIVFAVLVGANLALGSIVDSASTRGDLATVLFGVFFIWVNMEKILKSGDMA